MNFFQKNKKYFITAGILFLAFVYFLFFNLPEKDVRIGYFHGGRVNKIYQAFANGYFDDLGVNVRLFTKFLNNPKIIEVPKNKNKFKNIASFGQFGKMSGIEIVEKIESGQFDGGTIGESSFIYSINRGAGIVAVASLGYDSVPGKGIILRSDISVESPEDLKGLTLITRRAGPGDAIFMKEFLLSVGLDPDKDVNLIEQVNDDRYLTEILQNKEADGGLYHLLGLRKLVMADVAYVYRPMDWMNSQLSHAVLVFDKEFLENNKKLIQKTVEGYMRRIFYEENLPEDEKDESWSKAEMMKGTFQGMSIPKYDFPPNFKIDILYEMQDLLIKHEVIKNGVKIEEYINSEFIKKAYEKIISEGI